MNIHILTSFDEPHLRQLEDQLFSSVRLTTGPDAIPEDCQILVGGGPNRETLERLPLLRHLVIPFSGIPRRVQHLLSDFPQVQVRTVPYNSLPTAEMAIALLLAVWKTLGLADRAMRDGVWERHVELHTFSRKNALVLGYGNVGKAVCQMCKGLGIRTKAIRKSITSPKTVDKIEVFPQTWISSVLPEANALIVCLPLTDETEGMIGEEELALLPQDAVIVNVGRGPVIDEKALYEHLAGGHLWGAGLDVWWQYPGDDGDGTPESPYYGSSYPFHALANVILSPHRASRTPDGEQQRVVALARVLRELLPLPPQ